MPRALSSVGQSCGLIIRRSLVQVQQGPKEPFCSSAGRLFFVLSAPYPCSTDSSAPQRVALRVLLAFLRQSRLLCLSVLSVRLQTKWSAINAYETVAATPYPMVLVPQIGERPKTLPYPFHIEKWILINVLHSPRCLGG